MFSSNFDKTVTDFIAIDKTFAFMNCIKGTTTYWKKFLSDILAMVKQLGWPTFFMILSSEDLRWNELISITRKLNKINLPEDDINKLSYHERCHILNSNPVLVVAMFSAVFNFFWKKLSYHFRFDACHTYILFCGL